jgi:anti-sigma factor RsiW
MNAATRCPLDELQAFVDDTLAADRSEQVIDHLDTCAECRQRVDLLAGSAEDWETAANAFAAEANEWQPLDRLW